MNGKLIEPAERNPGAMADAAATSAAKLRHAAIITSVLVVVGVLAGLVPRWQHRSSLRRETQELSLQTVSVVSPSSVAADPGLPLPAELKPFLEAPIYARASGYLRRYLVDIGAQVKEGDLLAEIDTPELNQELAQARAQLAQAEAAFALSKTTAARWAELVKTASVSEQEALEKQADLELKSATVQAAKANMGRLEELQRFQKVIAPFAGTIIARTTDVGQLITSGSGRELFRLAQMGTLRVYVRVPEGVARGVAPGQTAQLNVLDLPGRVFPAKVVRTSGALSAESRTLLAELEVDNSRSELMAGSYAQVRFTEAKLQYTLTLPSNTLLFRAEGLQVGLVGADGKVELRSISIGRDFGPSVEIVAGLNSTDRVILNPADSLVSGVTVRVAQASPKTSAEK